MTTRDEHSGPTFMPSPEMGGGREPPEFA
jgi:hypothetical protein